jgi:hypothetical protein
MQLPEMILDNGRRTASVMNVRRIIIRISIEGEGFVLTLPYIVQYGPGFASEHALPRVRFDDRKAKIGGFL